jgi:predicted permease
MRTLVQDVKHGIRLLLSTPGVTLVAVLSLAAGIGASTAMFSFGDALVLRPAPVARPAELIRVFGVNSTTNEGEVSYADFQDLRAQAKSLQGMAASSHVPLGFSSSSDIPARTTIGLSVSPEYFDVLGVPMAAGRTFRSDELRAPVVILNHNTWISRFSGDPGIIGRSVKLSKVDFTVIGVSAESFSGLHRLVREEMYIPTESVALIAADPVRFEDRTRRGMEVHARLKPGVTPEQAQAELKGIAANLERSHPDTNRGWSVLAMDERSSQIHSDPSRWTLVLMLLIISGIVLLIACANVANLLLSRARARSRELAVRIAIGAGRGRLLRQLLTESLLLGLMGSAGGIAISVGAIRALNTLELPTTLPVSLTMRLDERVLLFSLAAAVLSSLLFGLAPAFQMLKTDLASVLKSGDSGPGRRSRRIAFRDLLVAGQVAVALPLLTIAGLLVLDLLKLERFDPGFRTQGILIATMDASLSRYAEADGRRFQRQLMDSLRAIPGVRSAAFAQHVPLGFSSSQSVIEVPGLESTKEQKQMSVERNLVAEGWFETMRIPIVEGRGFRPTDTVDSPQVAVVNETMAAAYWPGRSALGQRIIVDGTPREVVGIARNAKYRVIEETARRHLYVPASQRYLNRWTVFVEAAAGDPGQLASAVQAEVRRLDAGMTLEEVQTLDHFFRRGALFGNRISAQIVSAIGIVGLMLAVIGLYGVIAYSVSRRTREIGVRMAIGARPGDVLGMVLKRGLLLSGTGVLLGLGLAALGAMAMSSQLVGVSPFDPLVFAVTPVVMLLVGLAASYFPARRAAAIDPIGALRHD